MPPGESTPARRPFESIAGAIAGAVVLLDAGAGQLARWAGGVNYLMDELGALALSPLGEDEEDGDDDNKGGMGKSGGAAISLLAGAFWGAATAAAAGRLRVVVLLTGFLWEYEHAFRRLFAPPTDADSDADAGANGGVDEVKRVSICVVDVCVNFNATFSFIVQFTALTPPLKYPHTCIHSTPSKPPHNTQ